MDGFWYIGEKTASQTGVDYSNGSRPITVVARRFEGERLAYAVVKIPGGSVWAGIAMERIYHSGEYHVLQILEVYEEGLYRCADLMEFPLRN